MERLITLYPETVGPVAIRHISDSQEGVATAALVHFIDHPEHTFADELLKAYSAGTGMMVGMTANALSRIKDTRLIEAFQKKYVSVTLEDPVGYAASVMHIANLQTQESGAVAAGALQYIAQMGEPDGEITKLLPPVFSANLIAGNPIDPLFDFCFTQQNWRPWLLACLTAFGEVCDAWYSEFDLVEEPAPGALKRALPACVEQALDVLAASGLEKKVCRKLQKSFRKRRYEDILSELFQEMSKLIRIAQNRVGAESFASWLQGEGKPRRLPAVIQALHVHIQDKDPAAQEMMARAGLSIFSTLVELQGLLGLNVERVDVEILLQALFEERDSVEEDRRIAERLRTWPDQGRIIEIALQFIEKHPDSRAIERLMDYLAENMDARVAERLLKLDSDSPELDQKLAVAASRLGVPLLVLLPAVIESQNPTGITRSLNLMQQLPFEGSVNLLLKHWDKFWELDKLSLLEAIQDIGDRRFIPPLKNELKGIEFPEARIYHLLCLIHGEADHRLKKIETEMEHRNREQSKTLEAVATGDLTSLLEQPLNLDLKCRRCRKTYTYEVSEVTSLSGAKGDYIIADPIRCKNCGALNHCEKTIGADMAVMGRVLALLAMGDKGLKHIENGPLGFAEGKRIGGKTRSIEEALLYYKAMLAKNPTHVFYLIGYANTLCIAKRTDDALPIYQKALEYDPQAVEALVSLGQNAAACGNLKEAYAHLGEAVAAVDYGNYYHVSQDLRDFKAGIYEVYANIALQLGKYPEPMIPPAAAMPKKIKVGRNDLCPCGSGKKFKKCCRLKEN
jgi:tetratricopeptide (TPR) repeat protein